MRIPCIAPVYMCFATTMLLASAAAKRPGSNGGDGTCAAAVGDSCRRTPCCAGLVCGEGSKPRCEVDAQPPTPTPTPTQPPATNIVWQDNFETPGEPNPTNWNVIVGDGCPDLCGWGNNERQVYSDAAANVRVEDGKLKITALTDPTLPPGTPYTSGKLTTLQKVALRHGAVEFSAKLPAAACQGLWPAVWLLPVDNARGWPIGGEIDVLEATVTRAMGSTSWGRVTSAIHFGKNWPGNAYRSQASPVFASGRLSGEYVTYRCEWTPEEVRFYADGVLYNTQRAGTWWGQDAAGNHVEPFQADMHLIVNLAVGGANTPFTGFTSEDGPCIDTGAPTLEIDWIRLYESIGIPTTTTVACGDFACDFGEDLAGCASDCHAANQPPPAACFDTDSCTCADVRAVLACSDAYGGCYTCGARIDYVVSTGATVVGAEETVAGQFPYECGACAP